jgi:hypothetical protein
MKTTINTLIGKDKDDADALKEILEQVIFLAKNKKTLSAEEIVSVLKKIGHKFNTLYARKDSIKLNSARELPWYAFEYLHDLPSQFGSRDEERFEFEKVVIDYLRMWEIDIISGELSGFFDNVTEQMKGRQLLSEWKEIENLYKYPEYEPNKEILKNITVLNVELFQRALMEIRVRGECCNELELDAQEIQALEFFEKNKTMEAYEKIKLPLESLKSKLENFFSGYLTLRKGNCSPPYLKALV